MKNVLVTGGAGFIGSHVVVELLAAAYRPVIIDNFSNSDPSKAVERVEKLTGKKITRYDGDYQDAGKLKEIFDKESIDAVVHLAASKYVGESVKEPLRYYRNNVSGFVTLLEAVLAAGIKNFVFSSSAAVYGNPPDSHVTEEAPCNPENPYGWSKRMDEIILRDTCRANIDLQGVALRYFNVIGAHESGQIGESPKQQPKNLVPLMIRAAAGEGDPLTVHGGDYPTPDGTCLRDYIHVVDLAKAHVAALDSLVKKRETNYSVYNIGSGTPASVLEIITAFEKVANVKVPYSVGPRRPGDPAAYYAVPDKANKELGWKAQYSVEDAVRMAWNWQQAQHSREAA